MPKQAGTPAQEFEVQGKDEVGVTRNPTDSLGNHEARGNECVERGAEDQGLSHMASNLR